MLRFLLNKIIAKRRLISSMVKNFMIRFNRTVGHPIKDQTVK